MELASKGRQQRVVQREANHEGADGVCDKGDVRGGLTLRFERVQNLADFLRDTRGENHERFGGVFEAGVKQVDAKPAMTKEEVVRNVVHIGGLGLVVIRGSFIDSKAV